MKIYRRHKIVRTDARLLADTRSIGPRLYAAAHATTQAIRHALYDTAYCATVAAALGR